VAVCIKTNKEARYVLHRRKKKHWARHDPVSNVSNTADAGHGENRIAGPAVEESGAAAHLHMPL
jgi:hypothetical protein